MARRSVTKRLDRRGDDNLRTLLAQEAARIIHNQGIDDFRTAKLKAAEKLGLRKNGALPTNREIEQALAEHSRIFQGESLHNLLQTLRATACNIMQELQEFQPYLVGSVLSGNITEHSNINLHMFTDTAESVGMRLRDQGLRPTAIARNHRLRKDQVEKFPGYRFFAAEFEVETTVFPERNKAHSPLSRVDGKPMRRARLAAVEALAEPAPELPAQY